MEILMALAGGAAAGFGLAAPLGAIGVLLLREGLAAGFCRAAPAAAAVALVDAVYCTLAVLAGRAAAPVISSWGAVPAAAGGTALFALGLAGLRRTLKSSGPVQAGSNPATPRRFVLFLALTALNPATLLYFTALAAGLAELLSAPGSAAAFVAGAGAASGAWQLGLVGTGALLRGRAAPRLQHALGLAGHCTVAALGAAAVLSALR